MQPPRKAIAFLRWFCREEYLEEIEGDLTELFIKQVETSPRKARWKFAWSVIKYFRPEFIKSFRSYQPDAYDMYRSYFKIGWRNLLKNKGFAFINIGGLSVGVSVAILIGLWIYDELSFDKYHTNYNRIAQVLTRETDEEGSVGINTSLPYPLALELKANYADNFKHIVIASFAIREYILSTDDKNFTRTGQFIEPGGPEMLSLKMIQGSHAGLNAPNSIMLSASTAKIFFGDADPINQIMKINNRLHVTVTGVYADLPQNTAFNELKFIAPFDLWVADNAWVNERAVNDWSNHFLKVYAEILPTTDFTTASARIQDAEMKNLRDFPEQAAEKPEVFLHPMSNWHLYSFKNSVVNKEPVRMVRLIGLIGVLVLVLACINFVNLSTARSEARAKEVGIRKTIGSMRGQLIGQFFSESFLVVFLSLVFSLLLAAALMPWFNDLSAKQMTIPWGNLFFWLIILSLMVVTGILAGSYPAVYLSSFKPVKALKGSLRAGKGMISQRKILVITQFTISVSLIICTIIIYNQIQFAKNRPVGYSREGLIMLEMKSEDFKGKYEVLRTELKNTEAVLEVSESMGKMTQVWSSNDGWEWRDRNPALTKSFGTLTVTPEHGKTVGWQITQGRDFYSSFASDSSAIVINEAAMKYMEMTNPVGETVSWKFREKTLHYEIIGVVKDMVMESPYQPVKPTVFFIKAPNGNPNWINIKMNPSLTTNEALGKIEAALKKIAPTIPFDYKFVDEEYNAKFLAEVRIGKLASFFSLLAIFISCLGLFGLASFIAEQRTKEIGIRKVLGASIANLWTMLSRDFVVLVIISCCIAVPITYYLMSSWLLKYQYRAEISVWVFLFTGIGALTITLLTVSFQAVKVAWMNPVNSLKSE